MGYNSAITICNDAMPEIDKDPAGWWKRTKRALHSSPCMKGEPVEYGFGGHANGFFAAVNKHADVHTVLAVGGNYVSVLWQGHLGNTGHHTEEQQVKLLEYLADKLGYRIVRKK